MNHNTKNSARTLTLRKQQHKPLHRSILCLIAAITIAIPGVTIATVGSNYIEQFGITWTFDQDIAIDTSEFYQYGTFANGDYWITRVGGGPVTITGISPLSTDVAGRIKNGAMINPMPVHPIYGDYNTQGFDNDLSYYDSADNVALDVDAGSPLVVPVDSSLVSMISHQTRPKANFTIISDAAILTVLSSAPPANSFRPPWIGTDKTIKFNVSDLSYEDLKTLDPDVAGYTPSIDDIADLFERPWIDGFWSTPYAVSFFPTNNMPYYGREISRDIGIGALALNCDYTIVQKETLMIRFVQLGIDYYSAVNSNGDMGRYIWHPDGGHSGGRKWPILFAGIVLNDAEMKAIGEKSGDYLYSGAYGTNWDSVQTSWFGGSTNWPPDYIDFGEDGSTFYVKSADVLSTPYDLYAGTSASQYNTGTVKVTNGSTIVEGVGTAWKTAEGGAIKCQPDYKFGVDGDNRAFLAQGRTYEIASITDETHLVLTAAYDGTTDVSGSATYETAYFCAYGHYSYGTGQECWEYEADDIGLPESGIRHSYSHNADSKEWLNGPYRSSGTGSCWHGQVLSALLIDAKTLWNHNALFDYMDRYMALMLAEPDVGLHNFQRCTPTSFSGGVDYWLEDMWDTYRANYGDPWPFAPVANAGPDDSVTDNTGSSGSEPVTLDGSGSTDSNGTIVSWVWTDSLGDNIPDVENPTNVALTVGVHTITLTVTDNEGYTGTDTVTITVYSGVNTAPILASIGSKSGSEGLLIGFTTSASDSDFPANDLTFSLEGTPPTGASIDAVTGYFTWVPTEAQGPGTYNVTVRVTDDGTGNLYDEEVVAITVGEVNTPPTLDVSDFDDDEPVDELEELTFTATATDTDVPSNTLTYSLINAPAGASIGSSSGIFTWTPTEAQGPGSYNATVRVTDNGTGSLYDEETINISVTETNTTPVLDPIGNKATNVGSQLTFTADATDTDVPANTLTYSLTTAPAGASIGSETGVFTWTPSSGYEQTFNVTVRVTDDGAGNLFDEEAITITVGPDVTDPTVTNLSPADADVQVSIDSLIILTIADAGIGVDLDTVTIDVEGDRIYDGGSETSEGVYESTGNAQTVKGICRRTGTSAAYSFFFQADARFDYEKNITVTVNASDLASTSNDMAEQSYSFYTVMREFEGNIKVNSDTGTLVQDRPAVAKDSDGNIWTVWYQTTIAGDTDIYIGKLAANDSVFGESTQVTSDTNNQRNAVIAIDSNNKMYLAWQDFRQGEWDIYLTTSTDGVTFSTETRITDPNSNQINPDMAIDSSDKVYIVWEDDQNSNNDIYIASSTNSFASKTTSQITSNASGQGSPAIAIDSAKTVYVVWTDARNASNDIYGATSTSGPWTNAAIVNNANGQSSPVIATETSGTVLHLLWVDDTSGNNDIFYGATTGGLAGLPLTGTDISDDTTSSDQSNPSIFATGTTGSDLRVFACWKDSRDVLNNNGDTDIYYGETALGGSTFGTNVLVNDDSGTNTQSVPVVNVDINGNPYLAWVDNRGGNKDIYYAGAMLMGSVLVTSPLITVGTGGTVEVDDTTSNIDSATDVRVVIPAGTLPADTTITISEMINPPSPPSGGFGVNYEFGPSGLVFNSPVAIYLPHAAADCPGHAIYRAYWYNQELSAWYPPGGIAAQHGVDPVSGVHYITFETDHFTGFGVGGGSAGGGGGGGGGCSMSPDGQGTIVEFLVPYIGLAIVMAIMKLKGRRKKNLHRYTGSD